MRKNEVKAKVVVDVHEPLDICTLLSEFDLEVERKSISPGDYIVGEGWAVERKTTGDFVQSLFKGRLLEQLDRLAEKYSKPVLLVERDRYSSLKACQTSERRWRLDFSPILET